MTLSTPPIQDIPELTTSQRMLHVPDRLAVALEAKAMEKRLLDQMVSEWLEELRPQIEQMVQGIARRTAENFLHAKAFDQLSEPMSSQDPERGK